MAAGSLLAQMRPADFTRETAVGYNYVNQSGFYATSNGGSAGISLNKFLGAPITTTPNLYEYYNAIYVLPTLVALGTGLTFRFIITDDGQNAADLGTVVRLEVTPYNLSTALSVADFSLAASKGTATQASVTLGATTGLPVIGSIAIVAANLASLAAGSILGVRLRRAGEASTDTCANRVLCLGGIITDT